MGWTRRIACGAVVMVLGAPGGLVAAEPSVGVRAGSLGAGLEVGIELNERLTGRIGLFGWSEQFDFTASEIEYRGDLDLGHLAVLLDLHPSGRGFHWSFGGVLSDSELIGRAPLEQLGFDLSDLPPDVELPPDFELPEELGFLHGTWSGEEVAPYAGFGYTRTPRQSGWRFRLDVGTYYQGEPDVELRVETELPIDSVPGARELLDAALREEEADLEREARDYRFYPVLMLGVGYRF